MSVSILNQIYMISDVGCHKVLFVSNCFVSPKLWLLGSWNVHVLFCSVVLFKKTKQQNNYLCPAGDERSGVFCCWWQREFAIFAEQLILSLDELCCQWQKKQKHCSCCSCRGLKVVHQSSQQRELPQHDICLGSHNVVFVMKYVLCHFYFCNKSHTVFIFRPVLLLCLHLHICARNKWYWKLDKEAIIS